MKIMSKNFLKTKKESTAEVHIIFAVKQEDAKRLMTAAQKFSMNARRQYGADYFIEEVDAQSQSDSAEKAIREQEREITRAIKQNFEDCGKNAIYMDFKQE